MKRHYLKYACLTAGLLGAVILPSSLRAEDPAAPATPPPKKEGRPELTPEQREEMKKKRLDMLSEKLGLSDSQKEQVQKIMDEQQEKMKALKDDESLSKEDKMAKFKEISDEGREKINAILTDDQKAKFAEMKDRGPGGPGGHHGPKGERKGGDKPAPAAPQPTT